jgi:hypothetical protein
VITQLPYRKTKKSLIDASKESGLEVNTEISRYINLSSDKDVTGYCRYGYCGVLGFDTV